jgi:hypothetical protein
MFFKRQDELGEGPLDTLKSIAGHFSMEHGRRRSLRTGTKPLRRRTSRPITNSRRSIEGRREADLFFNGEKGLDVLTRNWTSYSPRF